MALLLDSAIHFLNEGGWRFTHGEEDNWASLHYTGVSGSWLAWFQDRGESLVAYAVCPVKVPAERWATVAEVISRANFGLGVGNFEMSFEDGTIRYKNGIYADDEQLSTAMVGHLFFLTNSIMDDYLPAIMAVIYGDTLPKLAIARVEEAIQLRRANADPSEETPADDADGAVAEPINEELATLLATLSAGFAAAAGSEPEAPVDDRTTGAIEDEAPAERQADLP